MMGVRQGGCHAAFFLLFILLIFCAVFVGPYGDSGGNATNGSFRQAKAWLEKEIYGIRRMTLYCATPYTARKRLLLPSGFAASTGWRPAHMTWEHAVPLEHFGRAFMEWRTGHPACVRRDGTRYRGRECAHRASKEFRLMEADMYNLFPAIDAVNSARGNREYAELPEVAPVSGVCPVKISGTRFEPPDASKGEVARASLYMAHVYPSRYRPSQSQRRLFEAWDAAFPVSPWECQRAKRIQRLQRNVNVIVRDRCQARGLWQ